MGYTLVLHKPLQAEIICFNTWQTKQKGLKNITADLGKLM